MRSGAHVIVVRVSRIHEPESMRSYNDRLIMIMTNNDNNNVFVVVRAHVDGPVDGSRPRENKKKKKWFVFVCVIIVSSTCVGPAIVKTRNDVHTARVCTIVERADCGFFRNRNFFLYGFAEKKVVRRVNFRRIILFRVGAMDCLRACAACPSVGKRERKYGHGSRAFGTQFCSKSPSDFQKIQYY